MDSEATGASVERCRIEANGLTFECLRTGAGDRLAVCLHGFPDDAGSMAPVMARLADAGFTAVAPYMRGYHPTAPAPDGDYTVEALGADAVALADALGERFGTDDAVLVGHDWGAAATYAAARIHPGAFSRLVAMAVPPGFELLLFEYPRQLVRSWYMWFFQLPTVPERALRWRNFALVEFLWGLWSPNWDYPPERLRAVEETFRANSTVENALAYYRDNVDPSLGELLVPGARPSLAALPPVEPPTLVLHGADDGCIGPRLYDRADEVLCDGRVVRVADAGHFLHQERPDVVGEELLAWLTADG